MPVRRQLSGVAAVQELHALPVPAGGTPPSLRVWQECVHLR